MAPRGRPRKLGTSRMDAAIDAMIPFGFPKELVRPKMNALLKEYGGDVGYPFIEAEAYKVLIDALLAGEEEESKQICAEGESIMKDVSLEDDGTGNGGNSWKDIALDQTNSRKIIMAGEAVGNGHLDDPVHSPPLPLPPIASSPAPKRCRRPCYGWISDGEEEDINFVILTPAVNLIAPPLPTTPRSQSSHIKDI